MPSFDTYLLYMLQIVNLYSIFPSQLHLNIPSLSILDILEVLEIHELDYSNPISCMDRMSSTK